MKFTKMHGLGNDYIYVNGLEEKINDPSKVAIELSDRHFGVGSDGLIIINPSKVADFEMVMYNADGSRGEMCGNGIRCVGKYVYDYGLVSPDRKTITVETLGGIKTLQLFVNDGKVETVKVNMGKPILEAEKIPVVSDTSKVIDKKVTVGDKEYNMTCVSMGNPHAVVFIDDVKNLDIIKCGPVFENHEMFPKRVNTEFAKVLDRKTIEMRVWERGSGETFACGTGSCATAVAAILNGYTDTTVTVKLLGGDLKISWDSKEADVFMEGPATIVFEGEVDLK